MSEASLAPEQVNALSEEQRWHWAEGTKFVIEAGKALMLINGGAAISILTFLGNKQIQSPPSVNAIFCFAFGALFAAGLFGSSYATQLYYGNSAGGSYQTRALLARGFRHVLNVQHTCFSCRHDPRRKRPWDRRCIFASLQMKIGNPPRPTRGTALEIGRRYLRGGERGRAGREVEKTALSVIF